MNSDWNESWNEYNNYLFVVDEKQNILGTIFSKKKFEFEYNKEDYRKDAYAEITGKDLLYLKTDDSETTYDFETINKTYPENVYFFLIDYDNSKVIYKITSFNFIQDKIYVKPNNIKPLSEASEEVVDKKNYTRLNKNIAEINKNVVKTIREIIENKKKKYGFTSPIPIKKEKTKTGGNNNDEIFNKMKQLVNNFEMFVNSLNTYPIIVKINSLTEPQYRKLFDMDKKTENKNKIKISSEEIPLEKIGDIMKEMFFHEFEKNTYNERYEEYISSLFTEFTDNPIKHINPIATIFLSKISKIEEILKDPNQEKDYINIVYDIMSININEIITKFQKTYKLNNSDKEIMDIINSLDNGDNVNFIRQLNEYVKINVSNNILSYVKINNFDHNKTSNQKWNYRFNILLNNSLDKKYNSMIVDYNNTEIKYKYSESDDNSIYNHDIDKYNYTHRYLFGNFTKIFPPHMKNPDIATQMTQIVEKVRDRKPVFIMGYGASGSGKTSSLIYFDKGIEGEKEGVVVQICKQICEGLFDTIELSTQELFSKNVKEENENDYTKKNYNDCHYAEEDPYVKCSSATYTFTYKDGNFIVENTENLLSLPIHHPYRITDNKNSIDNENIFAKTIEYLIDKDRLVKATTNNPQSSRSHSLAFIKFKKSDDTPGYLIVGDFAGVENKFDCDSVLTIKDLLNVEDSKDNTKLYYGGYTTEKYKENAISIITEYNTLNPKDQITLPDKPNADTLTDILKKNKDKITGTDFKNDKITKGKIKQMYSYKDDIDNIEYVENMNVDKKFESFPLSIQAFEKKDKVIEKKKEFENERKSAAERMLMKKEKKKEAELKTKKIENKIKETAVNKVNVEVKELIKKQIQKAQAEKAKSKAEAEKTKAAKEKAEAEEAAKKKEEMYEKFQNKKIDEDYFSNFIVNIIYPTYQEKFYEMVKLTVKPGPYSNMPFVTSTNELYTEKNFEENFKTWISNILKILKIDFIDKELKINMEIFTKYTIHDLDAKINFESDEINSTEMESKEENINKNYITFDEIKSTKMESKETNIINKYKTFNEINLNIQPIEGRTKDSIGNINSAIKEIKRKSKDPKYYSEEDVKTMFDNFKTLETDIDDIESEINKKLKPLDKTNTREQEMEDINNYKFFIDLFSKKSTGCEKAKQFTDNIIKIKETQDNILNDLKYIFKNMQQRLKKGISVCKYRRFEGDFINISLQDMREDIKNIFYEKQKEVPFISLDYVNLCLEKYCPTHSDCFKRDTTNTKNVPEIKSVIFKTIFNFLRKDYINYTMKNFYDEILISVFCVFNISQDANNPPPVPYVDINGIKIGFKQLKEFKIIKKLQDLDEEWDTSTDNVYESKQEYYKNILNRMIYQFAILIESCITNFNTITGLPDFDPNTSNDNNKVVYDDDDYINNALEFKFNTTTRAEIVNHFDDMKVYLKKIKIFIEHDTRYNLTNHIALKTLIKSLINFDKYLEQLIEYYDNQNAISAIGTLEFLDQISKYNTTETICFLERLRGQPGEPDFDFNIYENYFKIYKNGEYQV